MEKVVFCYNPRFELMPREKLKDMQLKLLKRQLQYVYNFSNLYNEKLKAAGLKPEDIKTLNDIKKIPVTVREDIENYIEKTGDPYGGICCVWTEGRQVNLTQVLKGFPGEKPIYIAGTADDFLVLTEQFVRQWRMMGIGKGDVVILQIDSRAGSHLGMVSTTHPAYRPDVSRILNCKVLTVTYITPIEVGRTLQYLKFFKASTVVALPQLFSALNEAFKAQGKTPKESGIKKIVLTTRERGLSDAARERLKEVWGCEVYNIAYVPESQFYAVDCQAHKGLHFWEDMFIVEALDENNQPVNPGEVGKLTITNLWAEGSPLIRFKTDMNIKLSIETCECGRTHARIIPVD